MTDFSPLDSALYESTPEKIAASLRYLRKADAVMAALLPLSANTQAPPATDEALADTQRAIYQRGQRDGYELAKREEAQREAEAVAWRCTGDEIRCFDGNGCECAMRGKAPPAAVVTVPALAAEDVQWIVNDIAELGVMIRGQAFFLYKGESLVYEDPTHEDDGRTMMFRPVFKREFGECCHPINYSDPSRFGTVSLGDSDAWKPLPPAMLAAAVPAESVPAESVAWQYRFATPDGLTWSDWQPIPSEAMARQTVDAFGKMGTRAEWRSLNVFEWGGYAGECTDADFADERAQQPAAAVPDGYVSMPVGRVQHVIDLLAERAHLNNARSPAHNARLLLEATLAAALAANKENTRD